MLGFYRFFLALGVLFYHANILPNAFGRAMVSGFFIVSGYLMALTLTINYKEKILPFYWNRIIRIFPLHIATCMVILLVNYIYNPLNSFFSKMSFSEILSSLLFFPTGSAPINPPAWTLSFEVAFYVMVPFLLTKGVFFSICCVVLSFTYLIIREIPLPLSDPFLYNLFPSSFPGLFEFITIGMPTALILFCLGVILFFLSKKNNIQSKKNELTIFAGLPALFILSFIFLPVNPLGNNEIYLVILNSSLILITSFFLLAWNYKEYRVSYFFGELCYPFYLIHYMLILLFKNIPVYLKILYSITVYFGGNSYFAHIINTAYMTFLTFLISFFWLLVEKKIRRYKVLVR